MMKGHLIVKAVDENTPASLSEKWKDYIEKHFDTSKVLMISDALNMGAIANYYTVEEATWLSIEAGNDMILMPTDVKQAFEALKKAIKEGVLTEKQLNASVKKILSKKVSHNVMVVE